MFRNYFAAALRNLARNRLYAAINIIGLSVGFTASLLIALFVRDELSYDKWIPGHEHIYRISLIHRYPGQAPFAADVVNGKLAGAFSLDFPQVKEATRLAPASLGASDTISLRHGDIESAEPHFLWGDANLFEVLSLPVVAGDIHTALARSDGLVVTREIARKYFGYDTPIGETIEINRQHVMTVTAVLENLPTNTHLAVDIIASGRASFSELAKIDARTDSTQGGQVYTYLKLASGATADDIQNALPAFIDRHLAPITHLPGSRSGYESHLLLPISEIHLHSAGFGAMKPSGSIDVMYALAAVGLLIVLVAGVNFINLTTIRSIRRASEVGVRKVSGALRLDLIVQFIGETLIYVAISASFALALTWVLLPAINIFLDRTVASGWSKDPRIIVGALGVTLATGILAGSYPAFMLSKFRPAMVLKGAIATKASAFVKQILVVLQFSILIGLLLATSIVYLQTTYALKESLRLNQDEVLLIDRSVGSCDDVFENEVGGLAGVKAASCSDSHLLGYSYIGGAQTGATDNVTVQIASIDSGFFSLYGVAPLAGRLLAADRAADVVPVNKNGATLHIVVNETASRKFGFKVPNDAIDKTATLLNAWPLTEPLSAEIVGVVPDFPADSIAVQVEPTAFVIDPARFGLFSVKLKHESVPDTLRAIGRLWKTAGDAAPMQQTFLDRRIQQRYVSLTRQSVLFAVFASIAIFISCLGLFGLSAFAAETRTKEIGVRKALGASGRDLLRLLLWEFTKPVLWANAIAWPVAYLIMKRWLEGFAYHIDLAPWMFLGASAAAIVIAMLTVAGHTILVVRAQPVTALRYE